MDDEKASPVKLATTKEKLPTIQDTICFICGKKDSENLRTPQVKGLTTFVSALMIRGQCNGIPLVGFREYVDFDLKIWKNDSVKVKWHAACYSTFTNPTNLKYCHSNAESDEEATPSTRSKKPSIDLQSKCMFCGFQKTKGDNRLIRIEMEDTLHNLQKRCYERSDYEFIRKIGGDIFKLPAHEARYHKNCFLKYMKPTQLNFSNENVHNQCFNQLIEHLDLKLSEGRAISLVDLLKEYQEFLKEKNYDNFHAYTSQKLRAKLLSHYGNSVTITQEVNKQNFIFRSNIEIGEMINLAQTYKQMLKDKELEVDEPRKSGEAILKRAASLLTKDLEEMPSISIEPLSPEHITERKVDEIISSSLKLFLDQLCNNINKAGN